MVHLLHGWQYLFFLLKIVFVWSAVTFILLFMTLFVITRQMSVVYEHLPYALLKSVIAAVGVSGILSFVHVLYLMQSGFVQEVLIGYFYLVGTMFEMTFVLQGYKHILSIRQQLICLGMIACTAVVCLSVVLSLVMV